MRIKTKKWASPLFIISLAVAGIFGVSAAVIDKQVEETPVVEEAKAYTEHNFYVVPTNAAYSIKVYYNRGWSETGTETFSVTGYTKNGLPIYNGSVWDHEGTDYFNNIYIQMFNGSTFVSECKYIDGPWTKLNADGKMFVFSNGTSGSFQTYSTDSYRIKCGSGSYVTMTMDKGGGLPSGVVAQFSATLNVVAGQSLTIQRGTSITLSPSFDGADNNYSNGAVIISKNSATVYLKLKSAGTYDCFVPGYTSCAVVVGGVQYTTTQSGEEYRTALINVDKGQTVKISWAHTQIATYLSAYSTGGCFSESGGTVTCLLTGAYTFYVQYNDYHSEQNTLYIERNNASTATYLASKFNTIILDNTCKTDGSTDPDTLSTNWTNVAAHFTSQPSDIKNLFDVSSGDSEVARMMPMYQYIIQKYGTSDFLGKGYTKLAIRYFSPLNLSDDSENSLPTVIIIVASSIALLSITALSVLVIKKRKQKEN